MNALESESAQLFQEVDGVSTQSPPFARSGSPQASRTRPAHVKILLFLLLASALTGAGYAYAAGIERVRRDIGRVLAYLRHSLPAAPSPAHASGSPGEAPAAAWDGFVRVTMDEAKTIGLLVVSVQPQVEPIDLPLMGHTAYDPNTLSKIRPRFDTLVEKSPRRARRESQQGKSARRSVQYGAGRRQERLPDRIRPVAA